MPLDTRIALGGQPSQIQFRDPIATYNQLAQLTSADTQNQLAQMQMQEHEQMAPYRTQEAQSKAAMSKLTLDQAVEARDFLTKTMKAAEENSNGKAPKDPLAVIKAFLGHPNKQVQDVGTHMANAYQLIQDFEADQRYATAKGGLAGAPAGVAAATPAAAPAAPQEMFVTKDSSGRPRYVVNGTEVSPQDYQSAQSGVVVSATPAAKLIEYNLPVVEPTNTLAPTAAAPAANVNAMVAPVAKTAADIKAEIDNGELQYGRSKRWAKERELLLDQYKEAIKTPVYHNVPGVGLVNPATRQTLVPSVEPTQAEIKQYEYAKNNGYRGSFEDFKVLSAPKTNISLTQNAEKSYGTAFGGKIADLDAAKLDAAGKAPDLAANANSVLSILNKGDVFVGPAATVKLNVARVLNAAGASNDEKIANTETLISNLGRNTLGMVKSSGLGTGQGFTDKDLQFLEKVAGGSIDYNEKTLRNLAELAHKAAAASAETWNKRVKEIPASATSGTGISLEPVVVPARITKAAAARPASVPAEWTLQVDGAGKRAYVSPDGKSFKEVP